MTEAVFWIFAVAAVVTASLCVLSRSALAAVLWLTTTMLSLAAIYVLLSAEFVAAIQVLVYAGAVMVLFLFVVMLLNLGHPTSDMRGPAAVATTVVIGGLLAIQLFALWSYSPDRLAAEVAQAPQLSDPASLFVGGQAARQAAMEQGVVGAVAAPHIQTNQVPLELTTNQLQVANVGAGVLAKRRI